MTASVSKPSSNLQTPDQLAVDATRPVPTVQTHFLRTPLGPASAALYEEPAIRVITVLHYLRRFMLRPCTGREPVFPFKTTQSDPLRRTPARIELLQFDCALSYDGGITFAFWRSADTDVS